MSIRPLFLAASDIAIGDTVMFVDLSVPEPSDYYWDFGDMTVSSEKGPMHIYYAEGTYDAMLTVGNGVCSASITKPLTVEGYNPDYLIKLAREREKMKHPDLILITGAKVYPNPASEYLKVDLAISQKSDIIMHLYGLGGRIYEIEKFDDIEQIEHSFDVSNLYQGLYFLRVATKNEVQVFKVVVAR
jgi:PKD repeat protein